MSAAAQPVLAPALRPWLSPIRDITPAASFASTHPFHPAVYGRAPEPRVMVMGPAGFPTKHEPAKPWVPGVSTPTGARLSTPMSLPTTVAQDVGAIALRVVEVSLAVVLAGGVIAVPVGAYVISQAV